MVTNFFDQLAHQYCNIVSHYCNIARKRTSGLALIYYTFYGNLGYLFLEIQIFSGSVNTNMARSTASTCVQVYLFLVEIVLIS